MKNRPLIVGNWKMNGRRTAALGELRRLIGKSARAGKACPEIVLCPPATLLTTMAEHLRENGAARRIFLGGQDCHPERQGAFTGDLSAEMLKDAGAKYVLLGHSERRAAHHETDALVRAKTKAAHRAGLIGVVCIGEGSVEREGGARQKVLAQLSASLPDQAKAADTVVAYEPIWAIGTGRTPSPDEIAAMQGALRSALCARFRDGAGIRIIYGGSVMPANAGAIMAISEVDGLLVGGASLKASDFWGIAQAWHKS